MNSFGDSTELTLCCFIQLLAQSCMFALTFLIISVSELVIARLLQTLSATLEANLGKRSKVKVSHVNEKTTVVHFGKGVQTELSEVEQFCQVADRVRDAFKNLAKV